MSDSKNNLKVTVSGRKTKRVYINKAVAEHLLELGNAYSASVLVKASSENKSVAGSALAAKVVTKNICTVSKSVAGSVLATKAVVKKSSDTSNDVIKARTGHVKKLRAV